MVSLWRWGRDDSSPASFEKTLSTLSSKIATTQAQLDRQRSTSRRIRVLWTLYLSFAYLVYAIVLFLVIGFSNFGVWEYTGLAGGPVVLYLARTLTSAFFNYRIDTLESRLKSQQEQRAQTIKKLKDATKYDTTLELLQKYGGGSSGKVPKVKKQNEDERNEGQKGQGLGKKSRQSTGPSDGRTGLAPPPTANIARPPSAPGTPQNQRVPYPQPPPHATEQQHQPTAEFAPNAGPIPSPYGQYEPLSTGPHWYDRILDTILGEDETAAKNRIVLICKQCRLVNGQAPPGTRSLAELGQWKCSACGFLNGEIDEGKKIIQEALEARAGTDDTPESDTSGDPATVESEEEPVTLAEAAPKEQARKRRGKGGK